VNIELPQIPAYRPAGLARHRIKLTGAVFFLFLVGEMLLGFKPLNPLNLLDPWVACGTLLIFAGLALRSWAAGLLQKKEKLATTGPYSIVRHPLYAGSVMMMFGFTALLGQPLNFLVTALLAFVSFGLAIRGEEKFLASKFGADWDTYIRRTNALIPTRMSFDFQDPWTIGRWFANREYNAWLGSSLGWLGLLAWHFWKA
jgi:protein-S-isoprenylcysteine O-methyltransferase Ste14